MSRFSCTRLSCVLPILFALLQCSHGTGDITTNIYTIDDPDDISTIKYNRATDTTIEFTVTVNQATAGEVDGIDVYFADSNGDKIGTEQAATGTNIPAAIGAGSSTEDIAANTVNLKFESEADCTAAVELCVLIKGSGVLSTGAEHCLDIGTSAGEAGAKDCADPPTPTAADDPTGQTDATVTDADSTTTEGESGAGTVFLNLSVLILVLVTHTLLGN